MLLKGYVFGIGYALLCLCLALVLYKFGLPKKYTRKVVHILVGFEWVILYTFFGAGVHFLLVCVFFLIILAVAHFKKLMPMISSDGENAPGTVYYAVAMTFVAIVGCFVEEVMLPFGIGIFCTSVGDGFAGVVGQALSKYSPKVYGNKTLFGCLANFVFSFLSAFITSSVFSMGLQIWHCMAIGFLSSVLEMVTGFGLDNITVTWGVTALAYAFMYFDGITGYILPILISPVIIAVAYRKKALTAGGIALAIVMDLIISLTLGNFGFMVLISFFVGSIIIDKIKKRAKNQGRYAESLKGDCRDIMQVLANGAVATVFSAVYFFCGNKMFVVAFVAALAEAFADTAASGIGAFSKKTFDPFRMKKCQCGISGGMSLVGTAASLTAAFLISALGIAFGVYEVLGWVIVSLAAFLGAIFDSMLGSLLQVKYKCSVCNNLTEKRVHCDTKTIKHSGIGFVNNDIVNLLSGIFASGVSILLSVVL